MSERREIDEVFDRIDAHLAAIQAMMTANLATCERILARLDVPLHQRGFGVMENDDR